MIPMIIICAQMIDQADIQMQVSASEPVAVVQTFEETEETEETETDEKIYVGYEDDTYVLVDLPCGHNMADDCVDWEIGDYYECKVCGYIDVYNPWYGHECEYELVYDGDEEYSMICMICGDGYTYIPTDEEQEVYWSQYDELETEELEED